MGEGNLEDAYEGGREVGTVSAGYDELMKDAEARGVGLVLDLDENGDWLRSKEGTQEPDKEKEEE